MKRRKKEGAESPYWLLLLLSLISVAFFAQESAAGLIYKYKPATVQSPKTPVLFLLHGYGSNEEDLFELSSTVDGHFAVFSVRAPLSLGNGGFAWYLLEKSPDNKLKYDYKEARLAREKMKSFIREVCLNYKLDSNAVFLLGFSQGAMLAYDIAFSVPGRIKGVLALSGRLMEQSKLQTNNWTKLQNTSFFIGHGSFDNLIPIKEAETARDFLAEKGIRNVEFRTYEMQHVLNGKELNDLRDWLKKQVQHSALGAKSSQSSGKSK